MDTNEEEVKPQKIATTPSSATPANDGLATTRPSSIAVTAEVEKRAMDHDSLVTVRLSEPPSLYINTAIPPNPLPSRKTVYGLDYTPTEIMTESLEEEPSSSPEQEPETPASTNGLSLQQELEETGSDSEIAGSDSEAAGSESEDGENDETPTAEGRASSESETVNWEQLQKTEDLESKDQGSDNVGLDRSVLVLHELTRSVLCSRPLCCSRGWSRKTPKSLRIRKASR